MPAAAPTTAKGVRPFRVESDPAIADWQPCVGCGGVRPELAVRHADPFCTTGCCRAWYQAEDR